MKKNRTIPFFILHDGCPQKCVFCDQNKITGQKNIKPSEIADTIERYLSTMSADRVNVEVGFFGGTFTGIPIDVQEQFLRCVDPFIKNGRIAGIRVSTRPDFIDEERLGLLAEYGVKCVELGVQSMSDKVLAAVKRGYKASDVIKASRMVLAKGFILGHQMMVGLPFSTLEDEYYTACMAKKLKAAQVRIYPLIVMPGTELAEWWRAGEYVPLEEDEAIRRSVKLILYFEANNIKVIRCGLHPSEGLIRGDYLAGPFHPAFKQKVESRIFGLMLNRIESSGEDVLDITLNSEDEAAFFGFKKSNNSLLRKIFLGREPILRRNGYIQRGSLKVETGSGVVVYDRKDIVISK